MGIPSTPNPAVAEPMQPASQVHTGSHSGNNTIKHGLKKGINMQHTSITIQPSNYLFHDKLGNQQGHVPVTPVSLPSNRFSAPKRSITMNFSGLSCCSFSTCPMYVHMNCRVSKYPETKKNINVKGSKHNINSIEFDNKLKGKCLVMSHRFPAGRGRGRQ